MSTAGLSPCQEVAPLLVFYVCQELSASERAQVEAHVSGCAVCAAQLAEELRFSQLLGDVLRPAERLDSSGALLAQCRSELAESLDDLDVPRSASSWHPILWMRRCMALHPVWSGAALLFFGIAFGTQLLPWMRSGGGSGGPAVNVLAAPKLTDEQLSQMAVSEVNFSPAGELGNATVQLHLSAQQPLVLSGNVDDPDIRRVLTYIVENGDRTHPDVRLDCLEALKARVYDLQVRQALLVAARKDQNPAVRIKALESLSHSVSDDSVRDALLDVLDQDSNPGVRVEAVNLLVHSLDGDSSLPLEAPEAQAAPRSSPVFPSLAVLGTPDATTERVIRVLEHLRQRDSSGYVRLRSADALREIARGLQ